MGKEHIYFTKLLLSNSVLQSICFTIPLLILRGYVFGYENHLMFVPSLYKLADRDFLQGDWYINSLLFYHYNFKLIYGYLMQYIQLEHLFFISYIFFIWLLVFSVVQLSKTLFQSSKSVYISLLIIIFFPISGFDSNNLIHPIPIFQPITIATPLSILALHHLLEKKYTHTVLILSFVTFIHLQIGVNVFLVFITYLFVKYIEKCISITKLFHLIAIYSVLAILGQLTNIESIRQAITSDAAISFTQYALFRMPHHFLPTYNGQIVYFLFFITLGLISYTFLKKNNKETNTNIAIVFVITIAGFTLQAFFVHIFKFDLLVKLQFYRLSFLLSLISILYFSEFVYRKFKDQFKATFKISMTNAVTIVALYTVFMHILSHGLFENIQIDLNYNNEWKELTHWIKNNVESDSMFISPPYLFGFHMYAERAMVVDYKSNPFLESDIAVWKERLEDVSGIPDIFDYEMKGFDVLPALKEGYRTISKERIVYLDEKYNADYIIFEKPNYLDFPVLHETSSFVIYELKS